MKKQKHRYITRIAEPKPHWWVRFQRMVDGARVVLFPMRFHDSEWGGTKAALGAAILYRDDMLKQVPESKKAPVPPGYGYVRQTTIGGRPAWEGWVRLEGRRSSRTKNLIDVWGPRVAKRRCVEWLARQREEIARRAAKAARVAPRKAA